MVQTLSHLAFLLKVRESEFEKITNEIDKYYYEKKTPKMKDGKPRIDKNGKVEHRVINPSKGRLMVIQQRINRNIFEGMNMPTYAFGAVKKRDNVLNAKFHQGNKYFFGTDLKNFYPSIRHQRVFDFFISKGFSPVVTSVLTKLTTYKGKLPQGIPTSSYLANLIFENTGNKINNFAVKNKLRFTTYVDDVIVSSPKDFKASIPEIISIINEEFKLNHKKTSYKTKNPEVTGLIVKANNLALMKKTKEKLLDLSLSEESRKGQLMYIDKIKKINKSKSKTIFQR